MSNLRNVAVAMARSTIRFSNMTGQSPAGLHLIDLDSGGAWVYTCELPAGNKVTQWVVEFDSDDKLVAAYMSGWYWKR